MSRFIQNIAFTLVFLPTWASAHPTDDEQVYIKSEHTGKYVCVGVGDVLYANQDTHNRNCLFRIFDKGTYVEIYAVKAGQTVSVHGDHWKLRSKGDDDDWQRFTLKVESDNDHVVSFRSQHTKAIEAGHPYVTIFGAERSLRLHGAQPSEWSRFKLYNDTDIE